MKKNQFSDEDFSFIHYQYEGLNKYSFVKNASRKCLVYIYILAWEPSVAHRLPAPCRKLLFYLFLTLKVDPLILVSQNQAKNILVILPSFQSNFEANRSRGF